MSSLRPRLIVLFLTVLQFALYADAKGGGKGNGSKSSGSKNKSKNKSSPVVYHQSGGKCYDEQYVQIPCPSNKATKIAAIVFGVIAGLLVLGVIFWYLRGRFHKTKVKSRDVKSKEIHEDSEDGDSIAPLVHDEEKGSIYSYDDKSTNV